MFWKNKSNEVEEILKNAPGPSPWYLKDSSISIKTPYGIAHWEDAGGGPKKSGKTLLKVNDKILAIVDFYHWIKPLDESIFLVWNQPPVESGRTAPLNIFVFDSNLFAPLENIDKICEEIKKTKCGFYCKNGLLNKIEIPTTKIGGPFIQQFPSPINRIEELLILINSSAVCESNYLDEMNLCILIVRPQKGEYEIIPQDWFNNGSFDFGYQWVTKLARNPKSGNIIGCGVRIGDFELDNSNRKLLTDR